MQNRGPEKYLNFVRFCELIYLHPKTIYKRKKKRAGMKDTKSKMRNKVKDQKVILEIKEIIKHRTTYGYKRVTALCNRKRVNKGVIA